MKTAAKFLLINKLLKLHKKAMGETIRNIENRKTIVKQPENIIPTTKASCRGFSEDDRPIYVARKLCHSETNYHIGHVLSLGLGLSPNTCCFDEGQKSIKYSRYFMLMPKTYGSLVSEHGLDFCFHIWGQIGIILFR